MKVYWSSLIFPVDCKNFPLWLAGTSSALLSISMDTNSAIDYRVRCHQMSINSLTWFYYVNTPKKATEGCPIVQIVQIIDFSWWSKSFPFHLLQCVSHICLLANEAGQHSEGPIGMLRKRKGVAKFKQHLELSALCLFRTAGHSNRGTENCCAGTSTSLLFIPMNIFFG